MTVSDTTNKPLVATANTIGSIANGTDTLKKTSSVIISVIEIALDVLKLIPGVQAISAGFGLLKGRLKDTKSVIGATGILNSIWVWSDPDQRKKVLDAWQKTANKVFLAVAQVFETVGFIDQLSTRFFSQASLCIGFIPIFDLVKNTLYGISSVFGLCFATKELQAAERIRKQEKEEKKKWEFRKLEFASSENFDVDNVVAHYQAKIAAETSKESRDEQKLEKWQYYIDGLNGQDVDIAARVKTFQDRKKNVYSKKQDDLGTEAWLNQQVALLKSQIEEKKALLKSNNDNAAAKQLHEQIESNEKEIKDLEATRGKVVKYEQYLAALGSGKMPDLVNHKIKVCDVRLHNCKNLHTKSWIGIAAEVGKIFMIILGFATAALSLAFPILTLPAITIAISSLGLAANSFGLAKNIYQDVWFKSNQQEEPQMITLTA